MPQAGPFALRELWTGGLHAARHAGEPVRRYALGVPGVPPQALLALLAGDTPVVFTLTGSGEDGSHLVGVRCRLDSHKPG